MSETDVEMSNKSHYDNAVAHGLAFTYFHGEDECPTAFRGTKKATFWAMERESAERNSRHTVPAIRCYYCDIKNDEGTDDPERKRVPPFITESTVGDSQKIVAYDCYAELRYGSNGFGYLKDKSLHGEDEPDYRDKPYNWNRGFDDFFEKV